MAQAKLITASQKLMQGLSTKFSGDPYIAEAAVIVPADFRNNPGSPSWFFGPNGVDYQFRYDNVSSASQAYTRCPPLAAIINRKAQAYINGMTTIVNAEGKISTTSDATKIKNLLARPNPLQSWKQFEAQQYIYIQQYGFCIAMPIYPFGFEKKGAKEASSIWNIPSYMVSGQEVTNKMWYNAKQISDILPFITLKYKDLNEEIPTDNLFIFKDFTPSMGSVLFPDSRIKALAMPINNIIASYESRNELINYAGSQGILTPKMDVNGPFTIKDEEKAQLQADFKRQYGIKKGQSRYIISPAPAEWQPMGKSTKDLMLFEEVIDDIMRICDGYIYPSPLLNTEKGPNVSSVDSYKKQVYEDAIIPESLDIYEQWNSFFKTDQSSIKIVKSYDHMPILQADQVLQGKARLNLNQALLIEYQNNIITMNQWRIENGQDPVAGDDIYYYQAVEQGRTSGPIITPGTSAEDPQPATSQTQPK